MIRFFLDLLFPKRCIGCGKLGSYICSSCFSLISFSRSSICPVCNRNSLDGATHSFCKKSLSLDGLTTGVEYRGIVKKLVYKFKYKPHVYDLKRVISKLLIEAIIQNETFCNLLAKKPVVVGVPLYKNKERQRGFNHSDLIASFVAGYFNLKIVDKVLIRTRDTKPQYRFNRKQRYQNIKDSFKIVEKYKGKIHGKEILLIDDLATTCVTLNECAKVLKRGGAEFVWGVVFAREV